MFRFFPLVFLFVGPVEIDLGKGLRDWFDELTTIESLILFDIRLPRSLLAMFIGATLGLAGAALQGLLRNPLAEPGIIGVSNGAALGAVIVFYYGMAGFAWFLLPLGGLIGALVAVSIILMRSPYAFSQGKTDRRPSQTMSPPLRDCVIIAYTMHN